MPEASSIVDLGGLYLMALSSRIAIKSTKLCSSPKTLMSLT